MAYSYTIDENNVVKIVQDGLVGSITQPFWPDGTPWKDADEAKIWAEAYIASTNGYPALLPPSGPNIKGLNQPSPEQIEEIEKARKAIFNSRTLKDRADAESALQKAIEAVNPAQTI